MAYNILISVLLGIVVLLFLILKLRIHAFLALLISSIVVGLGAGLDAQGIIDTIQKGMGGTLGFVATVVGLGAIFGAILEHSGGAKAISKYLLNKMGEEKAPVAMLLTGFIVAIPVFFDVAFIILVPVIYALQKRTKASLFLYAIPLLSGLAITHAFIPPTPGPVAIADILGADLGWVILFGIIVGLPTALVSGLWFGKRIANQIHIEAPLHQEKELDESQLPPIAYIITIIAVPIFLIVLNTLTKSGILNLEEWSFLKNLFLLIGHPFVALIIANLLAWIFLGLKQGFTLEELYKVSSKSFLPAGTIILLTGAGGVFKQVLVDTGAGAQMAELFTGMGLPILVIAFIAAVLVRIIQGSATVAMITAAGLVAPLLASQDLSAIHLALLVIVIASGASTMSHVNDSGFWLVSQYLGINEKQTFKSWSMMTTILSLTGFVVASLLFIIL